MLLDLTDIEKIEVAIISCSFGPRKSPIQPIVRELYGMHEVYNARLNLTSCAMKQPMLE